jgi:hypothetical protein
LIPEAFIKTFINRYLEERKGKVIEVQAQPAKPVEVTTTELARPLMRTIKWTVKGEDFPIPVEGEQARPYIGLVRNKVMKGLSEKGIVFEEEIIGGYIVSIRSSPMDEGSWNSFYEALNWAIRTIAQCKKEDIRIEVI